MVNSNENYSVDGWLSLALISLLLANILAILLIVFKLPFFSFIPVQGLFKSVLAYHVNLAMVFWMPSIACWFWAAHFKVSRKKLNRAFFTSVLASACFTFSLIDFTNNVSLSNYYPILHSKFFLLSLILQVIAVTLLVVEITSAKHVGKASLYLAKSAAFVWLIMVFSLIGNLLQIPVNFNLDGSFEKLLWAPGHIQQTVNSMMISAMWACFLKDENISPIMRLCTWAAAGSCLVAVFGQFFLTDEFIKRQIFTWQMSFFSWLPLAVIAFALIKDRLNNVYVALSLVVALLGIFVGMLITPGTLSIPGHYHGMTGAFNLAIFSILLKNSSQRYSSKLTLLYGSGIIMLILGLTWAGLLGVGRKLVADQQGIMTFWQSSSLALVSLGALLAIVTSIFIVKALFPKFSKQDNQCYP